MGKKLDELRLVSFITQNKADINLIQKTFVGLFNKCGKKYDNSAIQLGLAGATIVTILKNTNMPKKEVQQLLENISRKL